MGQMRLLELNGVNGAILVKSRNLGNGVFGGKIVYGVNWVELG